MRILLADSNQLFLESLKLLISRHPDLAVVGMANNGHDLLRLALELKPNIVVTEIELPGLMASEAIRIMTAKLGKSTEVVVLTTHDDEETLFTAIDVNASGYILKNTTGEEFIKALRAVWAGGYYLSPKMVSMLVLYHNKNKKPLPRGDSLTYRERQVLKMIAEGTTVKQIAGDLRLSIKTIEAHKCNMMRKLDIHRVAHLTRYAIEMKMIHIEMPVSAADSADSEVSGDACHSQSPEAGRSTVAAAERPH